MASIIDLKADLKSGQFSKSLILGISTSCIHLTDLANTAVYAQLYVSYDGLSSLDSQTSGWRCRQFVFL